MTTPTPAAGPPTLAGRIVQAAPVLFLVAQLSPLTASRVLGDFERDFDEGGNLMKALLVLRGAPLYDSVWSDQPPLFTWALAAVFRVTGPEVWAGRGLVLVSAMLLLACSGRLLRRESGDAAALGAMGLLAVAPHLWAVSISVMIGLPSLALAVAGLDAASRWRQVGGDARIAACGALLGAAVATKLLALPVVAVVVALLAVERRWRGAAIFGLALAVVGVAVAVGVGPAGATMITSPHLAARTSDLGVPLSAILGPAAPLLALAGVGALDAARARRPVLVAVAAWCALDCGAVVLLTPHWYHHGLLVSVPAALLAGVALGRRVAEGPRSAALAVGVVALAAVVAGVVADRGPRPPAVPLAVARLRAEGATIVLTDRPMVAFRAGATVPPAFAVVSLKRSMSQELEPLFAAALEARPAAVYLGRFRLPGLPPGLRSAGYVRDPVVGPGQLWMRAGAGAARDE